MKEEDKKTICPVRDVISRLSDKWSLLVLLTLSRSDKMRFNEVQKSLGDISQRMLTVTLRSLEADGLVNREAFAEIPPKVEYCLTPLGISLLTPLYGMIEWALENMATIIESREVTNKK